MSMSKIELNCILLNEKGLNIVGKTNKSKKPADAKTQAEMSNRK